MIIRGTTPIITFTLPFSFDLVEEIWFTMSQRGVEVVTKERPDMEDEGPENSPKIKVRLSQKDTLLLNDKHKVDVQVRIKTTGGDVIASHVARTTVEEILKEGVM